MASVTKENLSRSIAEELGFSNNQADEFVERVIELIKSSLISGDNVLISGFGKFCVKSKRERQGRNPVTGESIRLKARKIVTFKCLGKLRRKMNQ